MFPSRPNPVQQSLQPVPPAPPNDGRGNRLSATKMGVTTSYIYDPSTYRLSSDTHEQCAVVLRPPYSDIPREARQAPGKGACGNLIADADSNGVTHKYVYGNGLLAVATSSGRYCYHFNGTGSTVALTDMNQNIVNSYAHDPFGQILSQQETIPQPFKYVGQYGVMAEPNGLY